MKRSDLEMRHNGRELPAFEFTMHLPGGYHHVSIYADGRVAVNGLNGGNASVGGIANRIPLMIARAQQESDAEKLLDVYRDHEEARARNKTRSMSRQKIREKINEFRNAMHHDPMIAEILDDLVNLS